MTKTEVNETKNIKQETIIDSVRRGRTIGSSLKSLKTNYRNMQEEIFEKAKNGEVTAEDVANTLNALKNVETAEREMQSFMETTKN